MKNWQEIDPKTASHEELVDAFNELYDEHMTEEPKHLFFAQKVSEFTVIAGPSLIEILEKERIEGDGSIGKLELSLIEMNLALADCR